MNNLDYIRTLSAEELRDWFYFEWPKIGLRAIDTYSYMAEWLNETRDKTKMGLTREEIADNWLVGGEV